MKETEQVMHDPHGADTQVREAAPNQLTHSASKRISGNDSSAPVVIKWCNGREGLRGRGEFSSEIPLKPRLEWGEASHGKLEGKHVPGRGNSSCKGPAAGPGSQGNGMEPQRCGLIMS